MKLDVNLQELLGSVDVPVDWVGLREYYEVHTPRMIRDGVPVENGKYVTHGVMVEVLVNGQFGYYGTPNLSDQGVSDAANKAYQQAMIASKHSVYAFDKKARPAYKGNYYSPYVKDKDSLSAGSLNQLLLDAYQSLKVSDKIVSASSFCKTIETVSRFVSSNGGDIHQEFLMIEFDLSATAADGSNQQTRTFGGMRGTCRQMVMEYLSIRSSRRI